MQSGIPFLAISTTTTLIGVAEIGKMMKLSLSTGPKLPHCILVVFGGENYGEYARHLKRFAFITIQYLRCLWAFLGIINSGITVFSSDLLETVVTTTKSQNIK